MMQQTGIPNIDTWVRWWYTVQRFHTKLQLRSMGGFRKILAQVEIKLNFITLITMWLINGIGFATKQNRGKPLFLSVI